MPITIYSGVGLLLTDALVQELIANNHFTKKEWEDNPDLCLYELPFENKFESFSKKENGNFVYYFIIPGANLAEINNNVIEFMSEFRHLGIRINYMDIVFFLETIYC